MAGYIGKSQGVTQVDGYNRSEADAEFVQVTGDTMTGALIGTDLTLSGGVYLGGTGSANLLDDYEEGTWTPTAVCSGQTPAYGSQQGTYTKIGNVVRAQCIFYITSVSGSAGGNTTITGLPFSNGGTTYSGQGIIGYNDGFANTVSATWISSTTALFRVGARSSANDAGGFAAGYINIEWIYLT